jgi:hypothetical protein
MLMHVLFTDAYTHIELHELVRATPPTPPPPNPRAGRPLAMPQTTRTAFKVFLDVNSYIGVEKHRILLRSCRCMPPVVCGCGVGVCVRCTDARRYVWASVCLFVQVCRCHSRPTVGGTRNAMPCYEQSMQTKAPFAPPPCPWPPFVTKRCVIVHSRNTCDTSRVAAKYDAVWSATHTDHTCSWCTVSHNKKIKKTTIINK